MTNDSTPPLRGADCIRAALQEMPAKPGVYQMRNEAGDVLYVGKAKQLPNRVANYTSVNQLTTRIMRMVEQVCAVEVMVTASEAEALLLEANLIKQFRPRYNILLKDDKTFPHIAIERDHEFPRIRKHRGAQKREHDYIGPFASVHAVNQTLAILHKAFLLRPCSDSVFKNRSRPCLQYQIKRCSAPCVGYISQEDYAQSITQAVGFLKGKSREVQEQFAAQMQAHAEAMEYEKAALLRDRIRALTQVQQEQAIHAAGLDHADVIALARQGEHCCIQVMFFRGGNHFGNQHVFPRHTVEREEADILSAFIGQFYQQHTVPDVILTNRDVSEAELLSEALALQGGQKVSISTPQRGDKRTIVMQAEQQATQALERHLASRLSEQHHLQSLAKLFALEDMPQRIEVYDNSHISGQYALGAMIVTGTEGFDKSSYRRFNIRSTELPPGDDYGMMREVFTRRFQRLQRDDPDKQEGIWPDLVLIDGGQGQLSAVSDIFANLGIHDVPYCAIAKGPDRNAGRETFFLPDHTPFTLPPNDPTLHYLQRLRDEAHRYAIGSHRAKRSKAIRQSKLDEISGVGASRKRALLHHFGAADAVEQASLVELEKVTGISKQLARVIYDHFR